MELADAYAEFICDNLEDITARTHDDQFLLNLYEAWYTSNMNLLCDWLSDRMEIQLHIYQLNTLLRITKKMYTDMELHCVPEKILNSRTYETIKQRLQVEEATASVMQGEGKVVYNGFSKKNDSDDEDDD